MLHVTRAALQTILTILFEIAWRRQTERQKKRRTALLGIKRHRLSLINQAAWYQA